MQNFNLNCIILYILNFLKVFFYVDINLFFKASPIHFHCLFLLGMVSLLNLVIFLHRHILLI